MESVVSLKLQLFTGLLGIGLLLLVFVLRSINQVLINKKDYLRGYKLKLLTNIVYLSTLVYLLIVYALKLIYEVTIANSLLDAMQIAWMTLLVYFISKWIGETLINIDKDKTKIEEYKIKIEEYKNK